MKDFDVTVKLRNNHLVERREKLGLSAPQLAKAVGISYGRYNDYEYLRCTPMSRFRPGEVKESAQLLCDFFGVLPDELWPEQVLKVRCSVLRRKLDYDQMALMASDDMRARRLLPDAAVEELEAARAVQKAVASIPNSRSKKVIEDRFGIKDRQGKTREEVSEDMGVSTERIRQREAKGLHMLRHSSRSNPLRDFEY